MDSGVGTRRAAAEASPWPCDRGEAKGWVTRQGTGKAGRARAPFRARPAGSGALAAAAGLALTFGLGGCATKAVADGFRTNLETEVVRLPSVPAEQLYRAVRSGDGRYHLRVRFEDGWVEHLVYDPAGGARPGAWPPAAADLPPAVGLAERARGEWPRVATPVRIVAVEQPEGPGPAVALRGPWLLLRASGGPWEAVAHVPDREPTRELLVEREPSIAKQVGLVALFPAAALCDVAFGVGLGVAYVAALATSQGNLLGLSSMYFGW